jgi:hypothetical protein
MIPRLLSEIAARQSPERQEAPVPPHPNPAKENAIKARGEQPARTTLWRFAGIDLTRIDGISAGAAQVVLTAVGPRLAAFPSEDHFVSWLRRCPRTPISGGKPVKKRRNGLGANRIAGVLRMAATSLERSKTALGASFRRIARHKGGAVAVFATARQLARLVYRMLRYGHDYVDIGERAVDQQLPDPAPGSTHRNGHEPPLQSRPEPCGQVKFQVSLPNGGTFEAPVSPGARTRPRVTRDAVR